MSRWTAASVVARSVGGDPAERRRRRLLVWAAAGCTAFLLSAASLALWTGGAVDVETFCSTEPDGTFVCTAADGAPLPQGTASGWAPGAGLAPYITESGLRPGVVAAALLLVVPFAVFGIQVLRLGSAARERRLAALRLLGATSGDLRRIAAAEAWPAAVRGAALGLPAYLGLWVLLGLVAPPGWRLLPPPGAGPLLVWPVAVLLIAAGAAGAAAWSARAATEDALGGVRRRARPLTTAAKVTPVLLALFFVAVLSGLLDAGSRGGWEAVGFALGAPFLLVATCVSLGPWLVVLGGRLAVRSTDPPRMLAGRRLLADPRTPGRPAGVLFAVGLAIGITGQGLGSVLAPGQNLTTSDLVFYGGGYLLAVAAIGFAAVVAAASLVVGAGEQVLDARRPTAATVALGAGPATMRRVLAIQLRAAAVAPALVGSVVGALLLASFSVASAEDGFAVRLAYSAGGAVVGLLVAVVAAALGAAVAGRLLRGPLTEAMSVENLRTA